MTDPNGFKELSTTPTTSHSPSIVEEQLEKIFMYRKQSLTDELESLKSQKVVSDALELDSDSWAMMLIASNLGEKRTVMLIEDQLREQQRHQHHREASVDSSTDNSKSTSGVVGWNGLMGDSKAREMELLRAKDMIELEELQQQKVVFKSLQDPNHKFEEAALQLFGRKESLNKSQMRSGNILVSIEDDEENHQSRVKHQTQTLLDAVFRVPSAKRKLHKKLMKQIRDEVEPRKEESSNRFSKSADHVLAIQFDGDSSTTSGGTSEATTSASNSRLRQKLKQKAKRINKYHTLPHLRKTNGGEHRLKKNEGGSYLSGKFPLRLHHNDDCDTLEEISEGEGSVASQATLRSQSTLKIDPRPVLAPSPLHDSASRQPEALDNNEGEGIEEDDAMDSRDVTKEGGDVNNCEDIQLTLERRDIETHSHIITTAKRQRSYQEMVSMEFISSESHDSSIEGQTSEEIISVTASSTTDCVHKSLSDSSVSTSSFLTQSSMDSSIKSSDGDQWIVDESLSLSASGKYEIENNFNDQSGIPELPRTKTTGMINIQATQSWLDRYSSNDTTSRRLSSDSEHISSEEESNYPPVSDISLPSDPGITPFVIGCGMDDINPLSSEFSDFDVTRDKWKGTLVHPKAWEDPTFREYSNTLDHEPTNEDVILYKMFVLSEAIEEKFGKNLDLIIGEAFVLAMKDQLSYNSFSKLSHKLALQASGIKEGALLIAFLGRNLWEKLPELQEQIMEFTTQVLEECYDVGAPPDLSEIRADYDDWRGMTTSSEIQNSILQENAPFLIDPVESLPVINIPICSSHQLPPFPPDPEAYRNYLMSHGRPRIKQARSVEVLFKEEDNAQDEIDGGGYIDESSADSKKFTPPKRTISVSSFLEQDTRRSSNGSVFESIPPSKEDKRQTSPFNDSVITASSKNDVLGLLESVEFGETDTLPRPIIYSTESLPRASPSRHNSLESTSSTVSESSDNGNSPVPGIRLMEERKISGIHKPTFDAILEEHESFTTVTTISADNQMSQVNYEYINIIRTIPPTQSDDPLPNEDSHHEDNNEESNDDNSSDSRESLPADYVPERRRSSLEVLTEVTGSVMMIGLPLAVIALSAFKSL